MTDANATTIFTLVKNKFNEVFLYPDKNHAYDSFNRNMTIIKIIIFVMLIAMAIYFPLKFKSTGIVKSHPYLMLAEAVVFALATIVPFSMLVFLRNKKLSTSEYIKYGILLFVIFFVVDYLLELSGYYEYSFSSAPPVSNSFQQLYSGPEKFMHALDISLRTIFILIAAVVFLMMFLAVFFVHDTKLDYNIGGINKWVLFAIETVLFGAVSAIPIYFIASNRKDLDPVKTSNSFFVMMLKFMLLNVVLQFSGFYNHFFIGNYKY